MTRHYLDHASTAPARPDVVDAMLPWLTGEYAADPGRVHTEGRMARTAIEDGRDKVAALVGARSREVVFTSGATEAINAAVFGATQRSAEDPRSATVVATAVEHSAVLESSGRHRLVLAAVDGNGRVDVGSVAEVVDRDVALVHVQFGNHEVATLQPVAAIVELCRERGVLVHVDAAQAVGHTPLDFAALGADLMSITAHKMGGPKGIGALVVRRGLRVPPLLLGGEQERARRGGLENVPAIIGFGTAAEGIDVAREHDEQRVLTQAVLDAAPGWPGVRVYGDPNDRLPHIVCLGVDGVEAEAALLALDQAGIAAHSGSACSSESLEPSPVLEAMGVEAERSLRVSVGWSTTTSDIAAFLDAFPRVVERLRGLRGNHVQSPQ